jgi:cellulose synthase/poly-beta-1,6-N-acetylglucosamine synthase-like glycosyltransferase
MPSTYLLILFAAIYAGRVVFFVVGFLRERNRWRMPLDLPRVSVIVPARNEAQNIEACLRALCATDYPMDLLEIVVVDDRSTDGTDVILDRFAAQHPGVHVLHRKDEEVAPNLVGKPGALQYGIEHSTGQIALMTDADCTVSPSWVAGMVAQFSDERVGLVSGLTCVSGSSFFQRTQDVEWTYTQSMAAGGVGNGAPLGCFGNNLAVRRQVFDQLGGYRSIKFSVTEDMALQLAVADAGYTVRYAVHPSIMVETLPCTRFIEYVKQRHRWVRGGTALGSRAWAFVLTSIALWTGIILSAIVDAWFLFWGFLFMRLVADSALVALAAATINRRRLYSMIMPAMAVLVLTELLIPLLATRRRVTWKNQVFQG